MTELTIRVAVLVTALSLVLVGAYSAYRVMQPRMTQSGKRFSVHMGKGGWWAHIEGNAYPFGPWRMDRGPYPFRWMAALEFPIERLTKDGPRRPFAE